MYITMDLYSIYTGLRCISVVELMVRSVIESIPHGGHTELFPVPASVARQVYQGA